jgi:hypothetical protein
MKQEVMEKWVAALRSGKYAQGHGCLRDTNMEEIGGEEQISPGERFCCLGVLCDLYAKEHPNAQWIPETDLDVEECLFAPNVTLSSQYSGGDKLVLPELVRDWSGVQDDCGAPDSDAARDALRKFDACALTEANDHDATFNQLADFIEQHWQDL